MQFETYHGQCGPHYHEDRARRRQGSLIGMLHKVRTSHYMLKLWEQNLTYEGLRDNGRSSTSNVQRSSSYLAVALLLQHSGATLAIA